MADFPLLKNYIDRNLVAQIAGRIRLVHPAFPHEAFIAAASDNLPNLELKARFAHIADCLREHLPADYPAALDILTAIADNADSRFEPIDDPGLRLLPIPTFIERHGLDHPEASLAAMPGITRVTSCEGAIRPFIRRYPESTFAALRSWARDDNEHVRRLASEGSRPRLPWFAPLRAQIADPAPGFELLELLKDDPSLYVRRSVANHLNDISKDHPQAVLERMAEWSEGASAERQWLIKHALRTLLKRGDTKALAILGYPPPQVNLRGLKVSPTTARFPSELTLAFTLHSQSQKPQKLMVDFIVQFVKANGSRAPKVFKLKTLTLSAGESAHVSKRFAIRPISTRRYYPGAHRLEIQVNGIVLAGADFELVMP